MSKKCLEKCPVIQGFTRAIDGYNHQIDTLIKASMTETNGAVICSSDGHTVLSPEESEVMLDIYRKENGELYKLIEEGTRRLTSERNEIARGCAGPLIMRAVRGGVEYTATICCSELVPNTSLGEPANIMRRNV